MDEKRCVSHPSMLHSSTLPLEDLSGEEMMKPVYTVMCKRRSNIRELHPVRLSIKQPIYQHFFFNSSVKLCLVHIYCRHAFWWVCHTHAVYRAAPWHFSCVRDMVSLLTKEVSNKRTKAGKNCQPGVLQLWEITEQPCFHHNPNMEEKVPACEVLLPFFLQHAVWTTKCPACWPVIKTDPYDFTNKFCHWCRLTRRCTLPSRATTLFCSYRLSERD